MQELAFEFALGFHEAKIRYVGGEDSSGQRQENGHLVVSGLGEEEE